MSALYTVQLKKQNAKVDTSNKYNLRLKEQHFSNETEF